jgi:Domain of unknown function (DUF1929)
MTANLSDTKAFYHRRLSPWARFALLVVGMSLIACPQTPQPPAKPTNFVALEYRSDLVKLGWKAAAGAVRYQIERRTEGEAFKAIGSSTTVQYQDVTVQANSAYRYRLCAINAAGEVSAGVELSVWTKSGVNAVSLTTNATAIKTGDAATLTFAVVGAGDFSPDVTWNVNPDGGTLTPGESTMNFTSSNEGVFKITATSKDNPNKAASVTITVTNAPPAPCVVSGVNVQVDAPSVNQNQAVNLNATLNTTGACDTAVTWKVSPSGGTLTPNGSTVSFASGSPDTYTITATSLQDPSKSGTATVKVEAPASVTVVSVRTQYPMVVQGQAAPVSATLQGTGLFDPALTWTVVPAATLTPNGSSASFSSSATGAYTITATSVQDPSKSATTIINVVDLAAGSANHATMGAWSSVKNWPSVPINASLLSDGTVMTWDTGDQPNQHIKAFVWNPATDPNSENAQPFYDPNANLFCSGMTSLPDGQLFTAGGHLTGNDYGIKTTLSWNPSSKTWTNLADMHQGRWYPAVATMPDGQILAVSGTQTPNVLADLPELFDGSSWRQLTGASKLLPYYPWMYPMPNGKVLTAGPQQDMYSLDTTGQGSWTDQGQRDSINRDYGTSLMYRPNKVLVLGGGGEDLNGTNQPTSSTRLIDLETGANTAGSPMNFGRRQLSATMLPNGDVLVTGGSSQKGFSNVVGAVYDAEIWNPATGAFTAKARMQNARLYHSSAILLPDGRVFSGGGWDYDPPRTPDSLVAHADAEFYMPSYLFKTDGSGQLAPRPVIDGAPTSAGFGSGITLSTQDAASIQRVTVTRLGNSTHSNNFDQRYLELDFTAAANGLTVTLPARSNAFIPGVYMIFAVDNQGVPSVAKIIKVN